MTPALIFTRDFQYLDPRVTWIQNEHCITYMTFKI